MPFFHILGNIFQFLFCVGMWCSCWWLETGWNDQCNVMRMPGGVVSGDIIALWLKLEFLFEASFNNIVFMLWISGNRKEDLTHFRTADSLTHISRFSDCRDTRRTAFSFSEKGKAFAKALQKNYIITKRIKTISTAAKFKSPLLTLLKSFLFAPLLFDERKRASCTKPLHFNTFEFEDPKENPPLTYHQINIIYFYLTQ